MNSDIVTSNYANANEMLYGAHYVTLVSDKVSYDSPIGNFTMSYVTPNIGDSKFSKTLPKKSTGNVINNDKLGTSRITTSNYLQLLVPLHFFYITEIKVASVLKSTGSIIIVDPRKNMSFLYTRREYYKGTRFIVVNAGGNIDTPHIVGVEE